MPDSSASETIGKYVGTIVAHSFMEGNGRAMRIWLVMLLKK
jgi:cell filamentation protein